MSALIKTKKQHAHKTQRIVKQKILELSDMWCAVRETENNENNIQIKTYPHKGAKKGYKPAELCCVRPREK